MRGLRPPCPPRAGVGGPAFRFHATALLGPPSRVVASSAVLVSAAVSFRETGPLSSQRSCRPGGGRYGSRHVTSLLASLIALTCNGLILSEASLASPLAYIIIASLLTLFSIAMFVLLWRIRWPRPARIDPTLLRSSADRRKFAIMLGRGLVLGLVLGIAGGVVFVFTFAVVGWLAFEGGPGGAATLRSLPFLYAPARYFHGASEPSCTGPMALAYSGWSASPTSSATVNYRTI